MQGLQGPGLYVSGVIESRATTTLEPKYGPSVPQQNAGYSGSNSSLVNKKW